MSLAKIRMKSTINGIYLVAFLQFNDKCRFVKTNDIRLEIPDVDFLEFMSIGLSGRDWTSFYKIESDRIIDYGIVIYNTHSDYGLYTAEYKMAIEYFLAKETIKQ